MSNTWLSHSLVSLSRLFFYHPAIQCRLPYNPSLMAGLDCSAFAHHYLRNLVWFMFLVLLRCFNSHGLLHTPMALQKKSFQCTVHILTNMWVSPFGNLRVKGCLPPHQSLSQAATSFIVGMCLGIHHVLLTMVFTWKCYVIKRNKDMSNND